jgi:hypothetical protein
VTVGAPGIPVLAIGDFRTVVIDGKPYEVSTAPFVVGEWAAGQTSGGLYIQGLVTKVGAKVVAIKEEGMGGGGRRPVFSVAIERVYQRRPAGA